MTDPVIPRSPFQRAVVVGIALVSALVLAACNSTSTSDGEQSVPDYDPAPQPVNTAAPAAKSEDVGDLRLPFQLEENPVVDPQWQTAPQYADGVFLAAGDSGGVLTYRAVDSSGTVLWEAERPLSCTGFTLTSADGRWLAVLTDITPSDDSFGTTASAYDLPTGETVWGPVDIPGPHQGPGTVFAASPQAQMGELGPKMVLDPATGSVLAGEREDRENNDVQIVGEYGGTVLLVQQGQLQAHGADALRDSTEESEPVWTLDAAELGGNTTDAAEVVSPDAGSTAPLSAALVGTSSADLSLIDVETGGIIAEGLRDAAQGPSSGTWVTLGDQLAGYDASGAQLYAEPAESLEFAGIGAAMAYFRNDGGEIEPHNVVTGEIGRAYDPAGTGTIAVPSYISPSGTGVVETDDGFLLAPVD